MAGNSLLKPTQALRHTVGKMITDFHPDLEGVTVEPVFAEKGSSTAPFGKLHILAGVKALPYFIGKGAEDAADLANAQTILIVEVAKDAWDIYKEQPARNAMVDHLLCHCERDGDTGKVDKVEPDIQEFNVVANRHGKWNVSVKDFFSACQGKLKFEVTVPPAEEQKPRQHRPRKDEASAPQG